MGFTPMHLAQSFVRFESGIVKRSGIVVGRTEDSVNVGRRYLSMVQCWKMEDNELRGHRVILSISDGD